MAERRRGRRNVMQKIVYKTPCPNVPLMMALCSSKHKG